MIILLDLAAFVVLWFHKFLGIYVNFDSFRKRVKKKDRDLFINTHTPYTYQNVWRKRNIKNLIMLCHLRQKKKWKYEFTIIKKSRDTRWKDLFSSILLVIRSIIISLWLDASKKKTSISSKRGIRIMQKKKEKKKH